MSRGWMNADASTEEQAEERQLARLQAEVDTLIEQYLGDVEETPIVELVPWQLGEKIPVDVKEMDHEIIITAEMPDVDPEQVRLDLDGCVLLIRGQKRAPLSTGHPEGPLPQGWFYRSVPVPAWVETARAQAHYKDGVLTVRMTKGVDAGLAHIPIGCCGEVVLGTAKVRPRNGEYGSHGHAQSNAGYR